MKGVTLCRNRPHGHLPHSLSRARATELPIQLLDKMQRQAADGRGAAWVDYPPQGWDTEVGYPARQPIAGQHPPHNPHQQPRVAQLNGAQVQPGYAQQDAAYVQQQQQAYAYYAQQSAAYALQQQQQLKPSAPPAPKAPFRPPASQKSRPWAGEQRAR